jgi:hypothetical protein
MFDAHARIKVRRKGQSCRRIQLDVLIQVDFVQTHYGVFDEVLFAQNIRGRTTLNVTGGIDRQTSRNVAAGAVNVSEKLRICVIKVSVGHDRTVGVFEITSLSCLDATDHAVEAVKSLTNSGILKSNLTTSNLCTTTTLGTPKKRPSLDGFQLKLVLELVWPLLTGGRYSEVAISTGLTVHQTCVLRPPLGS